MDKMMRTETETVVRRKPPPRPPYLPLRRIHYANDKPPTSLHRRRPACNNASQQQQQPQLQDGGSQLQDQAVPPPAAVAPCRTPMMCRMAGQSQQPGAGEDLGGKISDELLVCKICYSRFSQRKLPKLLVCSHTFCEPCVTRYHKTASRATISERAFGERNNGSNGNGNGHNGGSPVEEVFPCPLCRKTTTLPEGGVEKLPNNLTVMSLMELMEKQPGCCTPLRAPSVCSLGGEPVYLTSATGTRLIGKSCSQDRIALALGVLCSVQTCAVCDKKYPESEFPCGHCVCTVCSSFANEDSSGALQCPKCAGDLVSTRTSPLTSPQEAVTSQPTSIQTEPVVTQPESVVSQPESVQTPLSSDLSITTGSSSPHPPIVSSSSPTSDALTSKPDSECSGKDHLQVIADAIEKLGQLQSNKDASPLSTGSSRDPPYNPSYVENPLYGTSSSQIKRKPTPPPPPMLQHERMQQRTKAYSLPRLSPKHISNPIPETFTREQRLARAYDSVHSINTVVSVTSFKSNSDYGTIRQPPVPPKRRLSTPRLFRRFSLRRRSKSCPEKATRPEVAEPSAPDSTSEPHYSTPSSLYRVPPPVPPPRRIYDSPSVTPIKCIKKFGKYSETRMQTSTFRAPTKVAVSEQGDIVVVDIQHMTVQVFTLAGDYLSMFKVVGVQGASFFSPDRLAVATHRGVTIYSLWGQKMHDLLTPNRVTNTAPFKFGFVACTPKCVYIYRQSLSLAKELTGQQKTQGKRRMSLFGESRSKKQSLFEKLQDIAVTMCKRLAVLDSAKGIVHIIDEDGVTRMTIDPAQQACGQLREPHSVTVDRSNNVYIADTGNQRVLRFANNGAFSRCVINCRTSTSEKKLAPYGLATTSSGHLVVVMAGNHTAEVRIYQVS